MVIIGQWSFKSTFSCYLLFKAMLVPGKTSQFTVLETRIPPAVVTLRAYPTLIIEYVLLCYSASCYVQAKKNWSGGVG